MSWHLTEKEIEAVLTADGKHRYEYFVHRVCETRKLWALYDDGWASLAEGDTKLIPFWPHEAFANHFKVGEWERYTAKEIALDTFLERWIPGMKREHIGAAIFPGLAGSAVLVSLDDLESHLRDELELYGEDE